MSVDTFLFFLIHQQLSFNQLCVYIFLLCYNPPPIQNSFKKKTNSYTCKQSLMMASEWSESARDNFRKFIYQFQAEIKTIISKLKRILIKLYRHNVFVI